MPILTKKESIKRRLQNDHGNQGKRIWNKVWDKFDSGYQCPSLSEGFDKIVKIGD